MMPTATSDHTSTTERRIIWLLLGAFVALSIAHALITPVWLNVEEPGHFEYVRYLVKHRALPDPAQPDEAIRQRIVQSYIWAYHKYGVAGRMRNQRLYAELGLDTQRDWQQLRDELGRLPGYEDLDERSHFSTASGGNEQLTEQPGYYMLAGVTQLFVSRQPVETQLIAARFASVLLGALSVWFAYLAAAEIFIRRRTLRVALPAVVAFLPSHVVLASSVNNTIAAVFVVTFALYASSRLIRRGYSVVNIALLLLGLGFILVSKNTAYPLLPAVLLAIPLAVDRPFPRWLIAALGAAALIGLLIVVRWRWPVGWYSIETATTQTRPDAALGNRALTFNPASPDSAKGLWQMLPAPTSESLRGETVMLGAWMRASDGPTAAPLPEIWLAPNEGLLAPLSRDRPAVELDETWRFYVQQQQIPADTQCMAVRLLPAEEVGGAGTYLVDGVVLAQGAYDADQPPEFASRYGQRGEWADASFDNLLQNPSAERGYPALSPRLLALLPDQLGGLGLNLNERIASFWNWKANRHTLSLTVRWLFTSFWSRYAWANPGLPRIMIGGLALLVLVAGVGHGLRLARGADAWTLWQRRALTVFLLGGVFIVFAAIIRLDPFRLVHYCDFYQGRFISTGYYLVPGALPLLTLWYLGLAAWVPERGQRWLLVAVIGLLFALTLGTLLGQQMPSFLSTYGLDPQRTLLMQLWQWTP